MRGYFGLGQLSAAEKSDILDQHKSVYNGYQTMQPQVSNTQPLTVYDFAGDKEGLVVNNKGEVKKYTNMGINEQVELDESNMCECGGEMYEGVCNECGYGHMEESELDESDMCEQCGGTMKENVCEQCGSGKMEEETGHLDDIYSVRDLNLKKGDFDYVEGGGNDYGTFEGMHKGLYKENKKDKLHSIINSLYEDDDMETIDNDDYMDYESSYTEDDMENPDNEDDGFEDINSSEVTDGEMDEIDVKDLVKGKKYRYKSPSRHAEIEFGDEHPYPEGSSMYSFKGDDTGHALNKKSVEDFIKSLDDTELDEQSGLADYLDTDDLEGYDFVSGGPEEFGDDTYSEKADDMDLDDEEVKPAFNFKSNGSNSGYNVNEDDMYGYDPEKMYEYDEMESAWSDDVEELDEQPDVSGVQGVYGDMKKAYDFDSDGPGKAGPYQEFSYESELDEEDDFEEVDEDLKESFLTQKSKINEMFNRFKKYN